MTTPADRGTLSDRLRQMADDVTYLTTHSDACWQWHESCALHRAADALDAAERPSVCPTCGSDDTASDGDRWIFTGRMGEFCPDPWHGGAE